MILQALKDYYDRKAADAESGIAPLGWEWKEIPFLAVMKQDGSFFDFMDTRELAGKKKVAKRYLVPSLGEAKGNGIKANLFWENIEYFFGLPAKKDSKPDRVKAQHQAFVNKIHNVCGKDSASSALSAVRNFVDSLDQIDVTASALWDEVMAENKVILLAVNTPHGAVPVTDMPEIKDAVARYNAQQSTRKQSICLVSGKIDFMKERETPIKGVEGAKTSGAQLVSVNNKINGSSNGGKAPAFSSFMKEQGANSPIGVNASLAYTTALNTLLGKDSTQKLQVGDATTVFWADKSCDFENELAGFFEEPPKDNPDALTNHVSALLKSVESGAYAEDDEPTRFFVLGLAPNAARIAVRFWHAGTVAELAGRFAAYFRDLEIAHGPKEQKHLSLRRLLVSTAVQGKSENIAPNLAGNFMRAILEGLPFPESLLQAVILRIKAEREVSYPRAKLIKGCLNRKLHFRTSNQERSLTVSLDKDNLNIGYRLGRLFATLEKIQEEANPGINATIRDRFYAAASSSPQTVFGNLMRLKNHHLAKLENAGRRVNFERQIGEIISGFQEFPAHLSLDDQGRFAIGYYHQRQDFFPKKPETTQD